jgi:tape measure domain-containing protein
MNVASLNVFIGGNPAGLISALNQSTKAVTQFSNDVGRMNARLNSSAGSITRLISAAAAGLSIREVVNYADSWTMVEARLRIVTQSSEELATVQRQLFTIAQENRSEFESTATLYTRLRQSQKQLGLQSKDFLAITRTVTQALAIEGRGAQEVSSTIRQLAQAFGSGRLAGDELRSVSENASLLFNKMAESLGLTTGEFRKLSSEGKISIEQVAQGILAAGAEIDKQAKTLPTTIGGSLTQLRNSVQRFVGETDRALGITIKLVGAINFLGNQFDNNRAAVETFAFVLGAAGLVKAANAAVTALRGLAVVQGIGAFLSLIPAIRSIRDVLTLATFAVRGFWTAFLGPIGIAVTAIGIAAAIFFKWRKGIDDTKKSWDEFRESLDDLKPEELTKRFDQSVTQMFRLEEQADTLRREIKSITDAGLTPSKALTDDLTKLETQIRTTTHASGILAGVLKGARDVAGGGIVKTGDEDALKKFADEAGRVVETFKIMKSSGENVSRVVAKMREIFDSAQQKLRGLKDPFSEDALRLRKVLEDLADLPEIKLRLRVDPNTRTLVQMTQKAVDDIIQPILDRQANIPAVQIRPIIDTTLAGSSIRSLGNRIPEQFRQEFEAGIKRIRFDVLRDRLREQLGTVPIAFEPVGLDRFEAAVDVAIAAQNRLNLARLAGDPEQRVDAEKRYADAVQIVRNTLAQLARNLDGTNAKTADQAKAIEAINKAAQDLGVSLTTSVSRLDQFLNFARGATGVGRAVLGIADAMKKVDESMRRALSSAVNLFDSLVDLAQAQKDLNAGTGSAITVAATGLGAAGAGLSMINSVVSAIQADNEKLRQVIREQTEVQRENVRALDKLRLDVGGFEGSVRDFQRVMGAIRLPSQAPGAPSMLELIRQIGEFEKKGTGPSTRNALEGALGALGTSLAELNAVADQLGIDLFDSAGRIIPEAFAILDDAIALHIRAVTRWRDTLEDTRLKMELEADVFDFTDDARAAIGRGLGLLETLAPNLFTEFFGSIDIGDPAQVEQALRALTRILIDNVESLEDDFGDLFGKSDLIEIIRLVEGGLDGLAGAANEVTNALLNVPSGFRIDRARFDATMAETIEDVRRRFDEFDFDKDRKGKPKTLTFSGDSFAAETIERAAGDTINIYGDILVDAREESSESLVFRIKKELKTKARTAGLSARPSSMLDN